MASIATVDDFHKNHDAIYQRARDYDIAFQYRDFGKELDFLVGCLQRYGSAAPTSFLELAAGPGVHAVVAAERGMRSIALDLAPAMMELCADKAKRAGVKVTTIVGDMARYALGDVGEAPVALAFNPITSISYLTSLEQLVEHFRRTADALAAGGVYVVENNHPKDFLRGEHFVPSRWTEERDGVVVHATWVADVPPPMDAARQCYRATGRFVVEEGGTSHTIVDHAWLRMTFPSELELCARLAGLRPVAMHGALDLAQPFDDTPASWRAVSVFAK